MIYLVITKDNHSLACPNYPKLTEVKKGTWKVESHGSIGYINTTGIPKIRRSQLSMLEYNSHYHTKQVGNVIPRSTRAVKKFREGSLKVPKRNPSRLKKIMMVLTGKL